MKFNGRKDMVRLIVVVLAAFLMAVNIKTFVRAGHLFPGGATGITVLIQQIFALFFGKEVPYSPINILLNAIPVYIGWRYIGKKFTLYSLLMIVLNGIFVDMLPPLTLTYDYLLISVFGGIINGVAISMCLMVDATSGGTDFLAIFFSKRRGVDSFNMILGINVLILVTAGLLFGWERALYSIIFQYVSTQVLHLLYRNYQQQTLFIVTNKADEVCAAIDKVCHHGATIMQAEGSYEHSARAIVYSVVSGGENKAVIRAVKEVDERAFINSLKTSELRGKFYIPPKD
ncbi:MAG: YitT family protein [Eubacterium sp.]|nr:YitT family protein [Eubacterium sp.]